MEEHRRRRESVIRTPLHFPVWELILSQMLLEFRTHVSRIEPDRSCIMTSDHLDDELLDCLLCAGTDMASRIVVLESLVTARTLQIRFNSQLCSVRTVRRDPK